MVDLRILPRPSSMSSDWFTPSHEGGGKPHAQHALCWGDRKPNSQRALCCGDRKPNSQHALCCGDRMAELLPEYPAVGNPHPSQPVTQGPHTQRTQPGELSSVLTGGWAVALEQAAGQSWSLACPLSGGSSAHYDTPMSTPPASPLLSVL